MNFLKKINFLFLFSLFLFIFESSLYTQSLDKIPLKANLPLGLSYDGTVVWLVDAKSRVLQGYHVDRKKKLSIKNLKIPGLRDIAFWKENLVTPYKKNIFVINPINGTVVKKMNTPFLNNPISIAINQNIAYIFDKKEKKVFRYDLLKEYLFGYFDWSDKSLRGATYYRGYLWMIRKDNFALKLNPTLGEIISLIPLPKDSYGIDFIDGAMFVSTPDNIQNIDYLETPFFTAASLKRYSIDLELSLDIDHLLKQSLATSKKPEEEKLKIFKKVNFELSLRTLPSNAHQRGSILSLSNRDFKKRNRENGEIQIQNLFLSNDLKPTSKLKISFALYTTNYFFTQETRKKYFEETSVPKAILRYIDLSRIEKGLAIRINSFSKIQENKIKGFHPSELLQFLYEQKKNDLDFQVAFFRMKGIPARSVVILGILDNDVHEYLQIYVEPIGWLTITNHYTPKVPYQFPISNTELELFYVDSFILTPPLDGNNLQDYRKIIRWEIIRTKELELK